MKHTSRSQANTIILTKVDFLKIYQSKSIHLNEKNIVFSRFFYPVEVKHIFFPTHMWFLRKGNVEAPLKESNIIIFCIESCVVNALKA